MTSNDNITLTLIYQGIQDIKSDVKELRIQVNSLDKRVTILENDVKELKATTLLNTNEISALRQIVTTEIRYNEQAHHYHEFIMTTGFTICTIFIGLVGVAAALGPTILEYFRSRHETREHSRRFEELLTRSR